MVEDDERNDMAQTVKPGGALQRQQLSLAAQLFHGSGPNQHHWCPNIADQEQKELLDQTSAGSESFTNSRGQSRILLSDTVHRLAADTTKPAKVSAPCKEASSNLTYHARKHRHESLLVR